MNNKKDFELIRIKPEWLNKGENPTDLYYVVEDREHCILISPIKCKLALGSIETVSRDMVTTFKIIPSAELEELIKKEKEN